MFTNVGKIRPLSPLPSLKLKRPECVRTVYPLVFFSLSLVPKLGTCLFSGDGIRRDVEKAASLFRKAAEQGATWSRISGAPQSRWLNRFQTSNWEKIDPQSRQVTCKLLCHLLLCWQVVRDIEGHWKTGSFVVGACKKSTQGVLLCVSKGRGIGKHN